MNIKYFAILSISYSRQFVGLFILQVRDDGNHALVIRHGLRARQEALVIDITQQETSSIVGKAKEFSYLGWRNREKQSLLLEKI